MKKLILIAAIFCLCLPFTCIAYSVLTHEAIIDATWKISIEPLLKKKYPGATDKQLKEAHAHAYGGAVAPDMGYFPFGSKLFTNLIHYVRSGDFVNTLLSEAQNINEYAFALGVLCHYNADNYGHPLGVNLSVPIVYPKVRKKYGDVVTFAQDHTGHIRTEFGFDVLQTARGNYASQAYHDFIGFQVSKPVLERAFVKTYGLDINDVFTNFSLAVGTFRWTIKNMFPDLTRMAWATKKNDILKSKPGTTTHSYVYKISTRNYYKEFGGKHARPGFSAFIISVFIRILPKIGPLKDLKFKELGPKAEKLFVQSFDTVVTHYSMDVKNLSFNNVSLPNVDYDTGNKTFPGEYELADANYGTLLLMLKANNFNHLTTALKQNIIAFYSEFNSATKKDSKILKEITDALEQLKVAQTK